MQISGGANKTSFASQAKDALSTKLTAAYHRRSHSGVCVVLSLALAALFFIGIHLGIAGTVIRDRVIAILGENGYRAGFAIATLIGLGWLVAAYNRAPYLVTWGMIEWWKPIAIILMLSAALLGRDEGAAVAVARQ
jgi:hypothetical protein